MSDAVIDRPPGSVLHNLSQYPAADAAGTAAIFDSVSSLQSEGLICTWVAYIHIRTCGSLEDRRLAR